MLITVCHPSLSGVSGQFMDTIGTTGSGGGGGGGTTIFDTFLFRTTGSDVLIAFGD